MLVLLYTESSLACHPMMRRTVAETPGVYTALKRGSALYVTLLALKNSGPGQRQHGDSLP